MDTTVIANVDGRTKEEMPDSLPPEVEEGNIEYKLKLVNPSASRFEHLVTQMKWRLQEGQGEALYEIGVEDNGLLKGLSNPDMEASLKTLSAMAERLGADISVLREKHVDGEGEEPGRMVVEVLVRKVPDNQQFIDLRLAVLGNVDVGKSTLLGVLTQGERDNGRGRARLNLFRHLHEIQSGRTSSISHEILGFDSKGKVVNYSESRTAEDICDSSTKLITLIDLCGHHKYLKTTIFGLTGHSPDFAVLVVSASTGIVGTTREHLGFALALGVPIFVVVTKIDLCTRSRIERSLNQLERLLKSPGCKKIPYRVKSADDAVVVASHFNNSSTCPIFTVSCVSGEGVELLTSFLNVLPPAHTSREKAKIIQEHAEHQIDEVFTLPSVGQVVGGTLIRGTVRENDEMLLGPNDDGEFVGVTIGSIHRNRMPCRIATSGQAACLSLGTIDLNIRKGMVLLSKNVVPVACVDFYAKIYLLFHTKHISKGFQTVVHVGNVCQTATIVHMEKVNKIKTNESALVIFRFINRPEFIREGTRLLFRDGQTKGMGEVTKIVPYENIVR